MQALYPSHSKINYHENLFIVQAPISINTASCLELFVNGTIFTNKLPSLELFSDAIKQSSN